ncbi:MAG: hypothetical protein RLZZ241_730 [Bacteroidota bacterium]|jgi:N4-(beta-N-acetylglucosaminyl)-L-asparaginase
MKRRKFIKKSTLGSVGIIGVGTTASSIESKGSETGNTMALSETKSVVVCTWDFGNASAKAWSVLNSGGNALDAATSGVMVEESNPENQTVGLGGRPDRDGNVTLDACIMDSEGRCGAVMALEGFEHPIAVARKVMEETPHVILVGTGAAEFALAQGFEKKNLLTAASKQEWEIWKQESHYAPIINIENHDTIGMITLDAEGNLAGACTTSGLAYKMKGRVGDSPIIGAGLFVDNEIGGAAATGLGEEVVRTVGSFLIVELMRQGMSPQKACEEGVQRIMKRNQGRTDFQIGFVALNKKGESGAYCIHSGFTYRRYDHSGHKNIPAESFLKS